MSISPHERTRHGRTKNRRATILLLLAVSIAFAVFYVLTELHGIALRQAMRTSENNTAQVEEPDREITTGEFQKRLESRLLAIADNLPAKAPESIRSKLEKVSHDVSLLDWSAIDDNAASDSIPDRVTEIERQVASLKSLDFLPVAAPDDVELAAVAESLDKRAEQTTLKEVAVATQRVRTEWQPRLRTATLAGRDREDLIVRLREQIANNHRESIADRNKAARAAALAKDMADVQKYLTPFTSRGHYQPNSTSSAWVVEQTVDAKPVSLARLEKLGAIKPTIEGLERLYAYGGGQKLDLNNDRPQGAFPNYAPYEIKKAEILDVVKRAQQLIRDHGQAMVETGLLSP